MSITSSPCTRLLLLVCGLLLFPGVHAAPPTPAAPDTLRTLQQQVDELGRELDQVKAASGPDARNQAMQRHWEMMQDHLRTMGQGMGMGPGMGMMGHGMGMGMGMGMGSGMGMMGHGMGMGDGMGSGMPGWAMPQGMTPNAYQQQMSGHMQTMRTQMAAIAAEKDPAKREALMREHYDTMYRHMQTMRGMGWMWAPDAAGALPDAGSKGAQLVVKFCSQCHSPPPPSMHTGTEWREVTARMRAHMGDQAQTAGAGAGVQVPAAAELDAITEYLAKHGRQ